MKGLLVQPPPVQTAQVSVADLPAALRDAFGIRPATTQKETREALRDTHWCFF